jgi:hypothetical protein
MYKEYGYNPTYTQPKPRKNPMINQHSESWRKRK